MLAIRTARLQLIACSAPAARAAVRGRRHLESRLGLRVHEAWPGKEIRGFLPVYARQLDAAPDLLGWGIWLIVEAAGQRVIGDVGFKGRPNASGSVDIGYGIVPPYRRQGYATEAAAGLREWAFAHPPVQQITADCLATNVASARVLEKIGMTCVRKAETGLLLWALQRPDSAAGAERSAG